MQGRRTGDEDASSQIIQGVVPHPWKAGFGTLFNKRQLVVQIPWHMQQKHRQNLRMSEKGRQTILRGKLRLGAKKVITYISEKISPIWWYVGELYWDLCGLILSPQHSVYLVPPAHQKKILLSSALPPLFSKTRPTPLDHCCSIIKSILPWGGTFAPTLRASLLTIFRLSSILFKEFPSWLFPLFLLGSTFSLPPLPNLLSSKSEE